MEEKKEVKEQVEVNQFLTFLLKNEPYALDILNVKEILEYGGITKIPLMPNFIRGVINLRGSVVPVIDLSLRFGSKQSEITKFTCIIVVEVEVEGEVIEMGVVVDQVDEVIDIAKNNIEPSPSFGTNIRADFILGMGKVEEKFIIILNINKVLDVEELSMIQEMKSTVSSESIS